MPIVTISRMFGAGGSEIAARVAEDLGWTLLDNSVVDAVAERLGVPAAQVSAREERVPSLIERLAEAMALGSPELMPQMSDSPMVPSEERLVDVTRRVVDEAVARGPVVVVGRGAQAMLAERADALHVLCVAPKPALIARVRARLGVDAVEAERLVDSTNRQREGYVKHHWQRAWLGAQNYHLCIDTEWLGIGGAVALVTRLARERMPASRV